MDNSEIAAARIEASEKLDRAISEYVALMEERVYSEESPGRPQSFVLGWVVGIAMQRYAEGEQVTSHMIYEYRNGMSVWERRGVADALSDLVTEDGSFGSEEVD